MWFTLDVTYGWLAMLSKPCYLIQLSLGMDVMMNVYSMHGISSSSGHGKTNGSHL